MAQPSAEPPAGALPADAGEVDPAPDGAAEAGEAGAGDEGPATDEDDEATGEVEAAGADEAAEDDDPPDEHPAAAATAAPAAIAPPSRSNNEAEPFIADHPFPGKCQAPSAPAGRGRHFPADLTTPHHICYDVARLATVGERL